LSINSRISQETCQTRITVETFGKIKVQVKTMHTNKLYLSLTALLLIFIFLCSSQLVSAQSVSDSLQLREIHIEATRIKEPVAYQPIQVNVIDSTTLQQFQSQDLGSLLMDQSFAFVQSNGPGGLQSLSLRGYDARHTQVIWEGFVINHPMVGTSDLSLIPVSVLSSVEISPGNPATSFGAGSSGGTVYLKTDDFINKIQLGSAFGSYGYAKQNLAIGTKHKNWKVTFMAGQKQSDNNFPYYNTVENKQIKRQNNALNAHHILTNVEWQKKNHFVKTALWYNYQDNHIANAVNFNGGKGEQRDNSVRWYGIYGGRYGKTHYRVKTYYSHYNLKYDDPNYGTHSRSLALKYNVQGQIRHYFSKIFDISGLISFNREIIKTNNYNYREDRNRVSGLVHGEYRPVPELRIYPALRFDNYSDFGSQVSPDLGVNFEMIPRILFIRAQIKRDFTAPTFNQLYWQPGGNKDLNPEKSWTAEAGFTFQKQLSKGLLLKVMPTYYNSRQKDGIRWVPGSNGVWSPVNILGLHMQGAELESVLMYELNGITLQLRNFTEWTKAEITKSDQSKSHDLHKQLSYVPKWSFKTDLSIHSGPIMLYINQNRTGSRYTTNDHSSSLDPLSAFNIINSGIILSHRFGAFRLALHAKVQNLFNKSYQIVAWYPMPGRNYLGSLNISMRI